MFYERFDVSGVRASGALMTHSELFRVNQDLQYNRGSDELTRKNDR